MKTTRYFDQIRRRRDRAAIRDEWVERAGLPALDYQQVAAPG